MKELKEQKLKKTYNLASTVLYYLMVRLLSGVLELRDRYQVYIYHIGILTYWLSFANLPLPIFSTLIDFISNLCEMIV